MGSDRNALAENPLSPKQQEIRDRPGLIMKNARVLIESEGFTAVTIDRLAKEMNCSRPPIYEQFSSREDVVMGLAIEDAIQRWKLLKRGSSFQGRAREKLTAMNEFTNRTYPKHLKVLSILLPNSVRDRATEKHRQTLEDYEARAFGILTRIVEEAINDGDLKLPGDRSAATLSYPIFCMSFGVNTFESRFPYWPLEQHEFDRSLSTRLAAMFMLDGFKWKPLSTEWDYASTVKRAHEELEIESYYRRNDC